MSSTQQAFQQFKEAFQSFKNTLDVMVQAAITLQEAVKDLEDQLTPPSHPVARQPSITTNDQVHEQAKRGAPRKYETEEERREAQRRASKKYYEKRKARLQELEEEIQRLKQEQEPE